MNETIPVVLLAYARPAHLARVLACLRENAVPLVYAFADGWKDARDQSAVADVRAMLRAVDWCEVRLTERERNLGLGPNVLAGVSEVAARHSAFIVWEDDLVAVPGTYEWMCAALRHYADDGRVMSMAAWTHPELAPPVAGAGAYFDARAESWLWGGYARSWQGMHEPTSTKIRAGGLRLHDYGSDLTLMAANETRRRTWAVRWIAHHFLQGGLCLRPTRTLVEHLGDDPHASNSAGDRSWENSPVMAAPPIPLSWPDPQESPGGAARWRRATWRRLSERQKLAALVYRWL